MAEQTVTPTAPFEPELTAFTCGYCAYMSGDTAGALRIQYPANVKVIRLPCTGKTDARYLMAAFEQGADGVYILACPIGNCHHVRGNERAKARVERTKKLLDQVGLGGERLDIFFLSGGMGESFAVAAREMTERVRRLGPSPIRNGNGRGEGNGAFGQDPTDLPNHGLSS
ncbi:MAG TPA: hydrogenase iron-sulfur subunit [Deferrisomatales bacterium]|nr:hydrogenase iron-sulfur subunit [Deferrisomatales bacterium]